MDASSSPSPSHPSLPGYFPGSASEEELRRLASEVRHKDQMLSVADNLRQSLEKDLASQEKRSAEQQKQIIAYAQLLREKEGLIKKLESEESGLRKEQTELGKRLREAENQAGLISKLRAEISQSQAILQAVETKIKHLEEDRERILAENKTQRGLIEDLKRKAKSSDLRAYLDLMQTQSEENLRLMQKSQESQTLLERKLAEAEKRQSALRRSLKLLFEQLQGWMTSFHQPTLAPIPTLALSSAWPELQTALDAWLEAADSEKEAVRKRLLRDESEKKDLRLKLDFFERATADFKVQIERLGRQVEKQEATTKATVLERESREKYWELKQARTKSKRKSLQDSLKSLKSDFERFEASFKPLLSRAAKLGFAGSSHSGVVLEVAADCLYFLLSLIDQRETERGKIMQELTAAQQSLAEAQGYKSQAVDLSLQLQSLGVSLSQAEAKIHRSDLQLGQLRELEASNSQLLSQAKSERERRETASLLLDSTLEALTTLKGNYSRLKSLHKVCDKAIFASCKTLAAALELPVPAFPSRICKFRAASIAIMAARRLRRCGLQGQNEYRYMGLRLVVPSLSVDRGFLRELLARASGRFAECLGSLFPKRIGTSFSAIQKLVLEISDRMQRLAELSSLKSREITIKEDKIRRLEQSLESASLQSEKIAQTHQACPTPEAYFALQSDHKELQSLLFLQQSRLAELEKQSIDYISAIEKLQEAVLELQEQAQQAGEQLEEAGKEGKLKELHIESLEGIVRRLEMERSQVRQ